MNRRSLRCTGRAFPSFRAPPPAPCFRRAFERPIDSKESMIDTRFRRLQGQRGSVATTHASIEKLPAIETATGTRGQLVLRRGRRRRWIRIVNRRESILHSAVQSAKLDTEIERGRQSYHRLPKFTPVWKIRIQFLASVVGSKQTTVEVIYRCRLAVLYRLSFSLSRARLLKCRGYLMTTV